MISRNPIITFCVIQCLIIVAVFQQYHFLNLYRAKKEHYESCYQKALQAKHHLVASIEEISSNDAIKNRAAQELGLRPVKPEQIQFLSIAEK